MYRSRKSVPIVVSINSILKKIYFLINFIQLIETNELLYIRHIYLHRKKIIKLQFRHNNTSSFVNSSTSTHAFKCDNCPPASERNHHKKADAIRRDKSRFFPPKTDGSSVRGTENRFLNSDTCQSPVHDLSVLSLSALIDGRYWVSIMLSVWSLW